MKNSPEKIELQKSRQIPICRATIKPWAGTALQGSIDCQLSSFNKQHISHLNFEQTCMVLTLELETKFLEVLNTSQIYPNTSKVCFVKGLANYIK